jgi:hypothetical protein
MGDFPNPALARFLAELKSNLVWGQLWIKRTGSHFEIRHFADRAAEPQDLRKVAPAELRELAMKDSHGRYRPLKSAPDLLNGWILICEGEEELQTAVEILYPGSIVDWFYENSSGTSPPITHYRQFVGRQSGMYRITQLLTDEQAAATIKACCDSTVCLKRRLWSLEGLDADSIDSKSFIPCLEPCGILLESARKTMRIEQDSKRVPQPIKR